MSPRATLSPETAAAFNTHLAGLRRQIAAAREETEVLFKDLPVTAFPEEPDILPALLALREEAWTTAAAMGRILALALRP